MRDWRGPIAFVLAVGVAFALVSGVVIAEVTPNMVTEQETTFFSTLGGAIVGAVATYLGVQHLTNGAKTMETEMPERDEPVEPEPTIEPEPTVEPEVDEPPTDDDGNPVDEDELTQGMGPGDGEGE